MEPHSALGAGAASELAGVLAAIGGREQEVLDVVESVGDVELEQACAGPTVSTSAGVHRGEDRRGCWWPPPKRVHVAVVWRVRYSRSVLVVWWTDLSRVAHSPSRSRWRT